MNKKKSKITRRDFLKTAGVGSMLAATGSVTASVVAAHAASSSQVKIPTRPFGQTGVDVPILALGGIINFKENQLLLHQAVKMGITYWDTAESYSGGRSEEGIGQYFSRFPEDRNKIFLVTKSNANHPDDLTESLNQSLERLKTDYVDLFFIHAVSDAKNDMDESILNWGKTTKAKKKIRLFGFSTHSNMEECLLAAPKLKGVDGIMMTYNYRLMHSEKMKQAVAACQQAGIGLTAMKTQAERIFLDMGKESDRAVEMTDRFMQKGYTAEQAKLKAVWEDGRIASICSQMTSMAILLANAAAATGQTTLSLKEKMLLEEYAGATRHGYCSGCTQLCEKAVNEKVAIGVVMRCLMYARSYQDLHQAKTVFQELPVDMRKGLSRIDYTAAEKRCPNRLPIARLMNEARLELA